MRKEGDIPLRLKNQGGERVLLNDVPPDERQGERLQTRENVPGRGERESEGKKNTIHA